MISEDRLPAMSWYDSTARQRLEHLLDADSFVEFINPQARQVSPHLPLFDLPPQFDDGIVIGHGLIKGQPVYVAAQEGRFMGGAFGEVHGAKLLGLIMAARKFKHPLLICFDTGGVRLQEANAGEVAIAEIMRAIIEARLDGVRIIGLIGGRAGCYGGGGLIAGCCSTLVISEQGRLSVSGPEVIETNRGVEEFDARDRAFVWRTMGGKHRYLLGVVDGFVEDDAGAFRAAACAALGVAARLDLDVLRAEQTRLEQRLQLHGDATDGLEIWQQMGVNQASAIPAMGTAPFVEFADRIRETAHGLR